MCYFDSNCWCWIRCYQLRCCQATDMHAFIVHSTRLWVCVCLVNQLLTEKCQSKCKTTHQVLLLNEALLSVPGLCIMCVKSHWRAFGRTSALFWQLFCSGPWWNIWQCLKETLVLNINAADLTVGKWEVLPNNPSRNLEHHFLLKMAF